MEYKKVKCGICGIECAGLRFLAVHLSKTHKITDFKKYYDKYLLTKSETCTYCNERKLKFISLSQGYSETCGHKDCIVKKRQETSIEKYGVSSFTQTELYTQKTKETSLRKYGVEHHAMSENTKSKILKKVKEKYGVDNVFELQEIKEKSKQTCLEKYGVENINQNSFFIEKSAKTYQKNHNKKRGNWTKEERKKSVNIRNLTTYNKFFTDKKYSDFVTPLFSAEEYKGVRRSYLWKCKKCGDEFKDSLPNSSCPRCFNCFPIPSYNSSKPEKEIAKFLSEHTKTVLNKRFYFTEDRKRYHEIDIFLPDYNIGIEYNGVYFHSEISGGKNKNYHITKTNFFEEKGIQIIHIFECEWLEKKEIIKSVLLSKINKNKNVIYARKCEIRTIDSKTANEFLIENHIQGKCLSSVRYGLFHENKLVSLMTFGKSRFNKKYNWELIRFCNIKNTSVIGGFSKLLKFFIKNNEGSIISYADRRFSNGNIYLKNNFKLLQKSSPNYFYLKLKGYRTLLSRQNFQKHKLRNVLDNFDENVSEWQNMKNNDYDRIWDCGNLVFVY